MLTTCLLFSPSYSALAQEEGASAFDFLAHAQLKVDTILHSAAAQDDITAAEDSDASDQHDDFDAFPQDSGRAKHFGQEGSWRFNVLLSYGDSLDDMSMVTAGVGVSWFFIENLSLDLQLGFLSASQPGPSARGVNVNVLLRWHFYTQPSWSLYLDGGAGLLKTNDDVPASGSSFNFTPQLGLGATFDIGRDWRVMVGVRWFHISNANLYDDNPGRDMLQLYAGLSIPF